MFIDDGVSVLWENDNGWLAYEYTGFLKDVYPACRAWVGHRCRPSVHPPNVTSIVGFVNAEVSEPKGTCSWCDTKIPSEVQGVVMLYNYGQEGEQHGLS